jgi:nicotinamidase-related amidase
MDSSRQIEDSQAALIVVDVQEGLVRAMDQMVAKSVVRNIQILLSVAGEMSIPVIVTEQYPKGLGASVAEIRQESGPGPIEKVSFSCCRAAGFNERLEATARKQILLSGMETHICVLQTCSDLIGKGYEVHVLADGVCSRRKLDWETGIRWMEKKGAVISTTEMIAFQLLKEAGTERFRRLSKWFK